MEVEIKAGSDPFIDLKVMGYQLKSTVCTKVPCSFGCFSLRAAIANKEMEVKAVNDLFMGLRFLVYRKYDIREPVAYLAPREAMANPKVEAKAVKVPAMDLKFLAAFDSHAIQRGRLPPASGQIHQAFLHHLHLRYRSCAAEALTTSSWTTSAKAASTASSSSSSLRAAFGVIFLAQ